MATERYIAETGFVAQHGDLAQAVQALLAWRTAAWSDRVVALAVLLTQLHGHRVKPYARKERDTVASEFRLSRFLGYKCRTPLVRRAIRRLLRCGWLRAVGPAGRGRRRVFEFWAGSGRSAPFGEIAWDTSPADVLGQSRQEETSPSAALRRSFDDPEYRRTLTEAHVSNFKAVQRARSQEAVPGFLRPGGTPGDGQRGAVPSADELDW